MEETINKSISEDEWTEHLADAIVKRRAEEKAKREQEDAELFKAFSDGIKRRIEEAAAKAKEEANRKNDAELLRMVNQKTANVQKVHIQKDEREQKAIKRRKHYRILQAYQYGSISSWVIAALLFIALVMRIFGMI